MNNVSRRKPTCTLQMHHVPGMSEQQASDCGERDGRKMGKKLFQPIWKGQNPCVCCRWRSWFCRNITCLARKWIGVRRVLCVMFPICPRSESIIIDVCKSLRRTQKTLAYTKAHSTHLHIAAMYSCQNQIVPGSKLMVLVVCPRITTI